jgi:hypothetical protein
VLATTHSGALAQSYQEFPAGTHLQGDARAQRERHQS